MSEEFLALVVPLLLPTALYALWLYAVRLSGAEDGGAWRAMPWVWLALAGVGLSAAVLFIVTVQFGTDAVSGTYVPPHLEGGQVVPGHIEPKR